MPAVSVEKLFAWFRARYGNRFDSMWADVPAEDVMAAWVADLADLTQADIARGLEACRKTRDWPPSAPEFRRLCLVQIDYEAAFVEAAHQWQLRAGGVDQWSEPAIFWAACAIGNDVVSYPYRWMANRWRIELDKARAAVQSGDLSSTVPPRREVLPNPAAVIATGEEARKWLGGER